MSLTTVNLLHAAPRPKLGSVLQGGLKASSDFDDLGSEMRQGVVYCWLCREDDKMWGADPGYAYLEVEVAVERCRVAEMDFFSLALMYLQGQGMKPRNPVAARLLVRLYEVSSVPLSQYRVGMFSTPEVLVKGDIAPEDITVGPPCCVK